MQHKSEYIWALIGRFIPLFIYLVTTMILARYLSPNDFGMVGVLSIFFIIANTIMDAGLGGSLVKEVKLSKIDCSTIFVFNLTVSLILYLLLFTISSSIEQYFNVEGLANVVKILCLIFIVNSWGLVPRSLLIRSLNFKKLTTINIISVIIASLASIAFAIMHFGVFALVIYQLAESLVKVILSIRASKFSISFSFSWISLKRLIPFGVFTTITTTIDTIYENLLTFLFGKYLNMQQAGYLSQAKRLEEVPSQSIAMTISNVAFPVLTHLRNNRLEFANECNNTFKTVLLLTIPLLFTMSIYSEIIIMLIYGPQWQPAAYYLKLLIFAAIFHLAETLNRSFIKSTTHVSSLLNYTIIKRALGISIIIICLMIEAKFILIGYIISTLIGFILNAYLLSCISEVKVWDQIKTLLLAILPNATYYLLMYFIFQYVQNIILQIIIGLTALSIYYIGILRLYGINLIRIISTSKYMTKI